jgi:hypothetical protein
MFIFDLLTLSLKRAVPPGEKEAAFEKKEVELREVEKGTYHHSPFVHVQRRDSSSEIAGNYSNKSEGYDSSSEEPGKTAISATKEAAKGWCQRYSAYTKKPRQRTLSFLNQISVMIFILSLVVVAISWAMLDQLVFSSGDNVVEDNTEETPLKMFNHVAFGIFAVELVLRVWATNSTQKFWCDRETVSQVLKVSVSMMTFDFKFLIDMVPSQNYFRRPTIG